MCKFSKFKHLNKNDCKLQLNKKTPISAILWFEQTFKLNAKVWRGNIKINEITDTTATTAYRSYSHHFYPHLPGTDELRKASGKPAYTRNGQQSTSYVPPASDTRITTSHASSISTKGTGLIRSCGLIDVIKPPEIYTVLSLITGVPKLYRRSGLYSSICPWIVICRLFEALTQHPWHYDDISFWRNYLDNRSIDLRIENNDLNRKNDLRQDDEKEHRKEIAESEKTFCLPN